MDGDLRKKTKNTILFQAPAHLVHALKNVSTSGLAWMVT